MSDHSSLKHILILDDDSDFRKLLITYLGKMFAGVELSEYDPVASGVPGEDFDWSRYNLLLLDYYLCVHGVTGLDILHRNRNNNTFPATIMLTGAGTEEVAVRALKAGAYDYLRKDQLDKEQLRNSILETFERHRSEREQVNELTNQSRAFNKALFYQQIEKPDSQNQRLLLIIQLDNDKILIDSSGSIMRDNIIRHIAKRSFEVFNIGECNPSITRLSDTSVALTIDDPGAQKTLEFNMQGLCAYLKKNPYKFEHRKFSYTVSIGVVPLPKERGSAEILIQQAISACKAAASVAGNSFHFHDLTGQADETEQKKVATNAEPTAASDEVEPGPEATPAAPVSRGKPESDIEIPHAAQEIAAVQPDSATTGRAPVSEDIMERVTPAVTQATDTSEKREKRVVEEKERANERKSRDEKTPPAVDIEDLKAMELDEASLKLKRAFNEKRVIQTFRPVISLFSGEEESEQKVYNISIQLIDTDGAILHAEQVQSEIKAAAFQRYFDRWMLREAIGRIINSNTDNNFFILPLGDASLADTTLFNWLRKLLSGLGKRNPGNSIALEISAKNFLARQKQVIALMSYLHKTHGFCFVLGGVKNIDQIINLTGNVRFDFIRVNHEMIPQFRETVSKREGGGSVMDELKSKVTHIIADNINDATMLTNVIGAGADYAMGNFIGDEISQLDEITNVESFEII